MTNREDIYQEDTHQGEIYRDNFAHLADELKRLDLLILKQILRIKQQSETSRSITLDPKLYVSDNEVEALLQEEIDAGHAAIPPQWPELDGKITALQEEIDARVAASIEAGVFLALPRLARVLGLSHLETTAVMVCLAPELKRKYDKIFVFLQDDIQRTRPSIDMVLELLCNGETEKWRSSHYFSPNAPLMRMGILEVSEDVHGPTGSSDLRRFLKLDRRILNFLLGFNHMDERLVQSGAAELLAPAGPGDQTVMDEETKTRLLDIIRGHLSLPPSRRKTLLFHFHGLPGVGKFELAREICTQFNAFMLCLDMELSAASGTGARSLLRLAFREALLLNMVIFIRHGDVLQGEDATSRALLKYMTEAAAEFGWLVILSGEKPWPAVPNEFRDIMFYSDHLPVPGVQLRERAWQQELQKACGDNVEKDLARRMARQFRHTPGQIREAVEYAWYHDMLGGGDRLETLGMEHLAAAGRKRSNQKLSQLAVKVTGNYRWEDIILPEGKKSLLLQVCAQVKHRHQVMEQWGFGAKLPRGNGLSVLFSGPPGTGKTMAAGVMARELQLDLYKIDLSAVVSKYIGETEKNLSRIFTEAEMSNGILFFDEADALFGKRSEVNDAHDRYANIETGYLLQRMEEYEGIVILATNFRKNMDEAFTRRIRYILEFPFPGEESRKQIWQAQFPTDCPRNEGIDYGYLARHFPISGGHIKNIVLDAAFSAAGNGGIIDMDHLLQGTRKEYEKIGKLWTS